MTVTPNPTPNPNSNPYVPLKGKKGVNGRVRKKESEIKGKRNGELDNEIETKRARKQGRGRETERGSKKEGE